MAYPSAWLVAVLSEEICIIVAKRQGPSDRAVAITGDCHSLDSSSLNTTSRLMLSLLLSSRCQVLNTQRSAIYKSRQQALKAASLEATYQDYATKTMDDILEANIPPGRQRPAVRGRVGAGCGHQELFAMGGGVWVGAWVAGTPPSRAVVAAGGPAVMPLEVLLQGFANGVFLGKRGKPLGPHIYNLFPPKLSSRSREITDESKQAEPNVTDMCGPLPGWAGRFCTRTEGLSTREPDCAAGVRVLVGGVP